MKRIENYDLTSRERPIIADVSRRKVMSLLAGVALMASTVVPAKSPDKVTNDIVLLSAKEAAYRMSSDLSGVPYHEAEIIVGEGGYIKVPKGVDGNIKDIYDPILFGPYFQYFGYISPQSTPQDVVVKVYQGPAGKVYSSNQNDPYYKDNCHFIPNKESNNIIQTPAVVVWEPEKVMGANHKLTITDETFVVPGGVPGNINKLVNQPVGFSPAGTKYLIQQEKCQILHNAIGAVDYYN